MLKLISFLAVVLLISDIAVASPPKTYRSKDGAFEIELPEGWDVDESGMNGTLAVLLGPARGRLSQAFVYVNLWNVGSARLEERIKVAREKFNDPPYRIVSERDIAVGSEPGHEFTAKSQDDPVTTKFVIVHFERKEYTFLYSGADNSGYATFEPAFQGMLRSVRWIKHDRTYRSPDGAFSLQVPNRWLVIRFDEGADQFVLLGPEQRGLSVSIAVSSYEQRAQSLDQFVARHIADSKTKQSFRMMALDDRRYILFDKTGKLPDSRGGSPSLGNRKAFELIFNLDGVSIYIEDEDADPLSTAPPKFDRRNVRVIQVITSVGDRIYIFSLNTFEDFFNAHKALLEEVLRSIQWF